MIEIALYQPDIPQNLGAMIRLCACMGIGLHVIEPCAFPMNERKIRQSAMDYMTEINFMRHSSWHKFHEDHGSRRVVLMSTRGAVPYTDFQFQAGDILLAGSESTGVPDQVHSAVDARIVIPMAAGLRSLNIVNATSMILGEALRQVKYREKDQSHVGEEEGQNNE